MNDYNDYINDLIRQMEIFYDYVDTNPSAPDEGYDSMDEPSYPECNYEYVIQKTEKGSRKHYHGRGFPMVWYEEKPGGILPSWEDPIVSNGENSNNYMEGYFDNYEPKRIPEIQLRPVCDKNNNNAPCCSNNNTQSCCIDNSQPSCSSDSIDSSSTDKLHSPDSPPADKKRKMDEFI